MMIYLYYKIGFFLWILWVLFVVKNFEDAREKIVEAGIPVFFIVSFLFVSVWVVFVGIFTFNIMKDIYRRLKGNEKL